MTLFLGLWCAFLKLSGTLPRVLSKSSVQGLKGGATPDKPDLIKICYRGFNNKNLLKPA